MTRFISISLLSILFFSALGYEYSNAQDQTEGSSLLNLYNESKFTEILSITESSDDYLSLLYKGKSLFALDRCSEAIPNLSRARGSSELEIKEDADWTIILCLIQLRDYSYASHLLFDSDQIFTRFSYKNEANNLKRELLSFLTEDQLLRLSRTITDTQDLLDLYQYGTFTDSSPVYSQIRLQLSRFHVDSLIVQKIHKPSMVNVNRNPPEGFTYRIGVLLPYNDNQLSIETQSSKALYNGLLLAIDELTEFSGKPQIQLQLINSSEITDTSSTIINQYWIDNPVDLVIGPLFSSRTSTLASHISQFDKPVIVPLANSDEIQSHNSPIIQLNPNFSVHGRQMARYAVNTLGLDTLSVITDRNSLGYAAAVSFKEEAERLGALIPTFFAEDMASTGYDISPFAQTLYSDSVMIDSLKLTPPQAIYAPFTGSGAQTLMRLLITDLTAKRNSIPILGLEEWNSREVLEFKEDSTLIYYSTPFFTQPDSLNLARFIERYEQRFGEEPTVLAQTGYDTGVFISELFNEIGNPSHLRFHLKNPSPYDGLRQRYEIRNYVNQSIHIYPLIE